jgi:hypothetical protein
MRPPWDLRPAREEQEVSVVWTWLAVAWAQVDEWPCKASPELGKQLEASEVSLDRQQLGKIWDSTVFAGSTSLLPPPRSGEPQKEGLEYTEYVAAHGAWTCTYGPPNLVDGDVRTAWVEGAAGLGVGELVVVPLSGPQAEIRAGYGKSPELYQQNARPRRVEVLVLGQGLLWVGGQYDDWFGLPVLGRHEVELRDVDGWQPLPLPAAGPPPAGWAPSAGPHAEKPEPAKQRPTYVAIRILSAYSGTKYEDTCISEVRAVTAR